MNLCFSALFLTLLSAEMPPAAAQERPAHTESAQLPHRARLVLSPEFCATSRRQSLGIWDVQKIGAATCRHMEAELKNVFPEVTRVESIPAQQRAADELLLVPRFVEISATRPLSPFSQRKLIILLEWTVQDYAGKIIWLQTVEGSSQHKLGWTGATGKLVDKAVKNLVKASATEMAASPELQRPAR